MAIEKKLDSGVKHGIIWHTQGSGKTALAFHNVRYLRDYYQKQGRATPHKDNNKTTVESI